jgi:hypothetical protein
MELLIRVVAGDAQAMSLAMAGTGESSTAVRDAAAFYIQQVMFATGSHSYRVLGLDPDASEERLKSHHRWLTRWLHPDRNRDEFEAIYSERVNRAWQDLRNQERRERYDQGRSGLPAPGAIHARGNRSPLARSVRLDGAEPGMNLRWLPRAIFGGLGVCALVIVTMFYLIRNANPPPPPEALPSEVEPASRLMSSAPAKAETSDGSVAKTEPVEPQSPAPAALPVAESPPPASMAFTSPENPLPPDSPAKVQASAPTPVPTKPRPEREEDRKLASSPREVENQGASAVELPAPEQVVDHREPEQAPDPAPISQRDANRLLGRFSEVYAEGDLSGMRAMFTADASSPDGGLDDILDEYDQLFERSSHRVLAVRNVRFFAKGETLTIIASYEASLRTGRLGRSRSHGNLRLELRRENDQWLIYRLQHHDQSG